MLNKHSNSLKTWMNETLNLLQKWHRPGKGSGQIVNFIADIQYHAIKADNATRR